MDLSFNTAANGKSENSVRKMEYPVMGGLSALSADPPGPESELETRLAEREKLFARQLESARREAAEQGRQAAAGEQEAWRRQCETALAAALEDLRQARDGYLARIEHEVVRLALAIAERILNREAQMDPLLLAGVVRVALGRLSESTAVRLRVPPVQKEMWDEMLRLMPRLPLRPEVVGDAALAATDAVMETEIGSVDLGIRAQIGEIERGFFDLPCADATAKGDPRPESAGEPA